MPPTVLSIVAGTRSEALECCTLVEAMRGAAPYELPFTPRLLVTGQEDTELLQTLEYLELDPDRDLEIKSRTSRMADAALNALLLGEMEAALRHNDPRAILAVGHSATAWATAVAAYFKDIPLIHLGAGRLSSGIALPRGQRPFPEWLHAREIARQARLHLCPDEASAEALREELGSEAAATRALSDEERTDRLGTIRVVGDGADEILARSLDLPPPNEEDPTLEGLRPEAPRVLIFIRRREHHANALKPLFQALETLSAKHQDHEFIVVYSLQAHICTALAANLPKAGNVRGVAPLPHPAFARELARARLVVTDSAGVGVEALTLGRPLVVVGDYSLTRSLESHAKDSSRSYDVALMERNDLESIISDALAGPAPISPGAIASPPGKAGQKALEAILEWWDEKIKDQG